MFEVLLFLLKKIKRQLIKYKETCIGIYYSKKKFESYKNQFLNIEGCADISLEPQFRAGKMIHLKVPIVEYYEQLYHMIIDKIEKKKPYTIIRVSDGEYFFLKGKLVGNGPLRHFTKSKSLHDINLDLFKNGLTQCDSIHIEMYKKYQSNFFNLYKKNIFSEIPFECIYALISSKKILKNKFRIGIIGADNKIEIIKKLLEFKEYREYIGRDAFQDYITVPERGSSNDVKKLEEHILSHIKDDIDIYLVGIGIAKLAVMHSFTTKSNAVFIDIGAGVSALAGLVSHERPYFGDWVNFRLKDFEYSSVDQMDVEADHSLTRIL